MSSAQDKESIGEAESMIPPMPDTIEITHRPGKEPFVEPEPKIILIKDPPIQFVRIQTQEIMEIPARIDLTQSPPNEPMEIEEGTQ